MVFKKWVENIQTAGYDGACTVYIRDAAKFSNPGRQAVLRWA